MTILETIETIEQVYDLVNVDLEAVDGYISDTLLNAENSATKEICTHLLNSNGKRIRPILSILIARALSDDKTIQDSYQKLIQISSAIELIHMASLVHDDVIDNSAVRRDQKSVNAAFGNSKAVAMGVYLYSMSLCEISKAGSLDALTCLSKAVKGMCEGELSQLDTRQEIRFDFDTYNKVITNKTADLFQAACNCGALLTTNDKVLSSSVKRFGHYLGVLFQLTDDYLDYFSDGKSLKKEVGQDYKDKQVTLPVLLYVDHLSASEKETFKLIFENQTLSFPKFLDLLETKKISELSYAYIEEIKSTCTLQLKDLKDSPYKLALHALVEIVFSRIAS
jgi:octaprenyl-diphosphate synthase